jgi:hypothetical protein
MAILFNAAKIAGLDYFFPSWKRRFLPAGLRCGPDLHSVDDPVFEPTAK